MSVRILIGDMRERLRELDDNSIDSCVCDPPYHLTSIVKRFGSKTAAPAKAGKTGAYARASRGFMGQTWDGGDVAFQPETWAEVFRVMKPGAHLLAFSGTRTVHRMVCAIEDVGFEIRDSLYWHYGSGFPKSHNLDGDWEGWGTALKPATEPVCLARKPLVGTVSANVLAYGTGALNIDACRVGWQSDSERAGVNKRSAPNSRHVAEPRTGVTGWGEGRVRSRDDLTHTNGRWPANVIHDGSDEVVGLFPASNRSSTARSGEGQPYSGLNGGSAFKKNIVRYHDYGDGKGSAARFFYCAKPSKRERGEGNLHPTVKPIDLMRWLCRLVTPPGGTVLDPFAGSGSTLIAADAEQFDAIGIELSPEYVEIAERRIRAHARMFAEVQAA